MASLRPASEPWTPRSSTGCTFTTFYDIPPQFHRNLGDMCIADPRFTKNYEDIARGLAQYVRDAIHANADRSARAERAAGEQS